MKKLIVAMLTMVMILVVLPINALAAESTVTTASETVNNYVAAETDGNTYATKAFDTYLVQQFAACKAVVDISGFAIPKEQANWLSNYILYELPEAFHVYYVSVVYDDRIITGLHVTYEPYADTVEEYNVCNSAIQSATNELLKGIAGNNALTDVEKALLLHDRLILWTEYDYRNYLDGTLSNEDYCLYGVLGQQNGVCKGYTMAYMYLLKQVGIESDYCSSQNMNHAWNIVYIDGKAYHVDVTWDDPTWDITGYVRHDNFLQSTAGIVGEGHDGGDFITTPTDTTYDDYYWRNSVAAFALLDNELYYIDRTDETLRKADTNKTVLCSVKDEWFDPEVGGWWIGIAALSHTDDLLLFSQEDGIYGYDIALGERFPVYLPDLNAYGCTGVFGFKYERGQLVLELGTGRSSDGSNKENLIYVDYAKPATRHGWVYENNNWYYFINGIRQTGWLQDGGKWYFLEEDGAMHTGWYYENGNWYYLNTSGDMAIGWAKIGSEWYYFKPNGSMVWNCDYTIGGVRHRFGYDGDWLGEITTNRNGWVQEGDLWYYYQNDVQVIGWKQIGGVWYFFDHYGGYMCTGWLYSGGQWYYFNASGAMKTGWLELGNTKYYLKSGGQMVTGTYVIDGKTHEFSDTGVWLRELPTQKNGWVQASGKWYYYQNGAAVTGWKQIGGTWYYFNANGQMATGWQKVGSIWYYFKSSGAMQTGWLKLGNTWYYFHASGAMATGSVKIGNKTYNFNSSGVCLNP